MKTSLVGGKMKWFDLSFSDVGTNCLSMFHIVN